MQKKCLDAYREGNAAVCSFERCKKAGGSEASYIGKEKEKWPGIMLFLGEEYPAAYYRVQEREETGFL